MSHEEHRAKAEQIGPVRCAVLTVSDTRTEETDTGGRLIKELVLQSGNEIAGYRIVRDEVDQVRTQVQAWLDDPGVDAVIVTGSSGIGPRDISPEAVRPLLDKELPGFGELFRNLSFPEIGPAAMMSRAFGGCAGGKLIFCLPGSPHACRLAMERLILPELNHLVWTVRSGKKGE